MSVPVTRDDIFALLAVSKFGAIATSPDGTAVFWNQQAQRILGITPAQVLGQQGNNMEGADVSTARFAPYEDGGSQTDEPLIVSVRSASGEQKHAAITLLAVAERSGDTELWLHLFDHVAQTGPPPASIDDGLTSTAPSHAMPPATAGQTTPAGIRLSKREIEILRLVAAGRTSQQIAEDLDISIHTVHNHVRLFRSKLDAKTKLEAVVNAMRFGIL